MAVVPIITVPDPRLVQKCEKVGKVDKEIKELAKNLVETLLNAKNPEGAGLAAPQIGVLKRVCVVREFFTNPDPASPKKVISKEHVLIDPKYFTKSDETEIGYEGCLSIPDVYAQVKRSSKIKIKALNENGDPIRITARGFFARVIQHEIDHLDGILFTTKLMSEKITEAEMDEILNSYDEQEAFTA